MFLIEPQCTKYQRCCAQTSDLIALLIEYIQIFGGIKERGVAEQAYESIYAYLGSDIAEGEGGGGAINKTIMPRLNVPKRIANNTIILSSPGETLYHICDGWEGNAFGNQFFSSPHATLVVKNQGCCSNCNITCCLANCTKRCASASFTLQDWQRRDPAWNDPGTTLTREIPPPEWIIAKARALLMPVATRVAAADVDEGYVLGL